MRTIVLSKVAVVLMASAALVGWTAEAKADFHFKGLTAGEYQSMFDAYVAQGYRPVAIRGFESGGQARYDVTYARNNGRAFVARHGIRDHDFVVASQNLAAQGYRIVLASSFRVQGVQYHAAVWER